MNKYGDAIFNFFNCFPYKHSFFNTYIITLGLYIISKL